MDTIEVTAFVGLSKLEKLDISSNQLQFLPPGVFDGLRNLRHLNVRTTSGGVIATLSGVIAWLRSLPSAINVPWVHVPESRKGAWHGNSRTHLRCHRLPSGHCAASLANPFISIYTATPQNHHHHHDHLQNPPLHHHFIHCFLPRLGQPHTPISTFPSRSPASLRRSLKISFHVVNSTCIDMSWESYFTVTAYKVTWVKMGQSLMSDITRERTVPGYQRRLSLSKFRTQVYLPHLCYVLDTLNTYRPGEDTICSEAKTKSTSTYSESEQAAQQDNTSTTPIGWSDRWGSVGGLSDPTKLVLLAHAQEKAGRSSSKWKYNRGRKKR